MNWIEQMNEVLNYIESNLAEEISYTEISRIAAFPDGLFPRVFAKITGIPLSVYIRNRRLTRAAFEIQSGDEKIIDLAVKYGYQSADAFGVAFKRLHGVTPSAAKERNVVLKSFGPLSFTQIIEGVNEMNYRIVEKEAFTAVGKVISGSHENNPVPEFWETIATDGTLPALFNLGKPPLYGISFDMKENDTFKYMAGIESNGTPPPAGMETLEIPASTWIVFESIGPMPHAIQAVWKRIFSEFLPQSIYQHAGTPDMEVYFDGDNTKADYRCEIWIPVVKK